MRRARSSSSRAKSSGRTARPCRCGASRRSKGPRRTRSICVSRRSKGSITTCGSTRKARRRSRTSRTERRCSSQTKRTIWRRTRRRGRKRSFRRVGSRRCGASTKRTRRTCFSNSRRRATSRTRTSAPNTRARSFSTIPSRSSARKSGARTWRRSARICRAWTGRFWRCSSASGGGKSSRTAAWT